MILKIENTQREDIHGWRFIEVEDVKKTSGFDNCPDGSKTAWIRLELLKGSGKELYDTLILNTERAYLMNNEGKTIDRLN